MIDENANIKIVGKRVARQKTDWDEVNGFLKLVIELRQNKKFIPKGVYRFKSHEESDEWIMKMLTDH